MIVKIADPYGGWTLFDNLTGVRYGGPHNGPPYKYHAFIIEEIRLAPHESLERSVNSDEPVQYEATVVPPGFAILHPFKSQKDVTPTFYMIHQWELQREALVQKNEPTAQDTALISLDDNMREVFTKVDELCASGSQVEGEYLEDGVAAKKWVCLVNWIEATDRKTGEDILLLFDTLAFICNDQGDTLDKLPKINNFM